MTITEHLHKYGVDCAMLFQDYRLNEHTADNMDDFKKKQTMLTESVEREIRKAYELEGMGKSKRSGKRKYKGVESSGNAQEDPIGSESVG
jgi:hypothetical protein